MRAFNLARECGLVFAAVFSLVGAAVILPDPAGPYQVGLTSSKLTDSSRLDPFDPAHGQRELMISIFHPIPRSSRSHTYLVPYLPPATASFEEAAFAAYGIPNGTLSSIQLQIFALPHSPQYSYTHHTRPPRHPVILFSPALGTTRLFYNFLAQSIASAGYVVITIDHPYDADIVEFPDGKLVYFGNGTDIISNIELAVSTRAEDASFVLDQLSNATFVRSLNLSAGYGYEGGFDVRKVGMLGHSLGGGATGTAMVNDTRIIAGCNLDGSFWGPVISSGLDQPFLLFGAGGKTREPDLSWEAIWPHLRGWKLELGLDKAQHYTFSDLPFLVKRAGLEDKVPREVFDGILGTLDGERAMDIVRVYVTAFFDSVLKKKRSGLLEGKSKDFPEVEFVEHS